MWKSFVILIVYLSLSINSFALAGFVVNADSLSSETNDYIRLQPRPRYKQPLLTALTNFYFEQNLNKFYLASVSEITAIFSIP